MMIKDTLKKILKWAIEIISTPIFIYFLILNIVANSLSSLYFQDTLAYVSFVLLAAIITFVELSAIKVVDQIKWLKIVMLCVFIALTNVLIVVDSFLIKEFNLLFGEDVINIIADTNPSETSDFIQTYFSFSNILLITSLIVGVNAIAFLSYKLLSKLKFIKISNALLCAGGLLLCCFCVYSQVVYGTGRGIPQYASATRFAHSGYLLKKRAENIYKLQRICDETTATTSAKDDRIIILVIGESYNMYHSQLYGYDKPTSPKLTKLKDNGELYIFNNVVTPYNATHSTMQAIYSLGDFANSALFPCCFKKAGYYTHISESQYSLGASMNFLTDKDLSEKMFTSRSDYKCVYDEILVDSLILKQVPALYVMHLQGQHYTYENRYPMTFRKFKKEDYDSKKWNENQREIIAHYDNATLYNDHVINSIIEKCRGLNVCLIYFSDHGEEVYDVRDYMGHGDLSGSNEALIHQIKIPFMIWLSERFKTGNQELADKIKNSIDLPITTNDISHVLLGLGEVNCQSYNPKRDFISDEYDENKHRVVLKSIDWDNLTF